MNIDASKALRFVVAALLAISCSNPDPHSTGDDVASKDAAPSPQDSQHVVIMFGVLTPPTVHLTRGGTVTWTNSDDVSHHLVGGDVFDSDEILGAQFGPGAEFSVTFDASGTVDYYCVEHPEMIVGQVIVE